MNQAKIYWDDASAAVSSIFRFLKPGRLTLLLLAFFLSAFARVALAQMPDERTQMEQEVDNMLYRSGKMDGDSEKMDLATRSLALARQIRYDQGVIRAASMLGELNARSGNTEAALQYFLEAESKMLQTGQKGALPPLYDALGDLFFREKMSTSARRYYRELLAFQPENFSAMEKAADAYLMDFRYDSAEYYYSKLIAKYLGDGNNPRLVQIYQKLATAYDQNAQPQKSLEYYHLIEFLIERFGTIKEKALLYNNLGRQYTTLRDYKNALIYFQRAEVQCAYTTCDYLEVLFANMGVAHHNTGNSKQGIDYLLKARKILVDRKDNTALANLEHLLAGVYFRSNDVYNAISHNDIAMRYAVSTNQRMLLAETYRTAADLYHELYDFEKAYEYYKKYLNQADSVRLEEQMRLQRLNQQRTLLAAAEGQIKYLIARQNFKDLELAQSQFERERLVLLTKNLELESRRKEDELLLLQKQKEVDQSRLREQTLQALRLRQEQRLTLQQLGAEKQARLIEELRRQEEMDEAQRLADSTNQAKAVEILRRDKDIADLQLGRQQTFRNFAYGLGSLLLLLLSLLGVGWYLARKTGKQLEEQNKKIHAQNVAIEEERHKSDSLLINILPDEIARELKAEGHADPHYYDSVTVLFTDFVNFTQLSTQLTPEQLINELDECFLAFDEICERYGLEKIKTIGDAYMCAGGLPVPNSTHPTDAVEAALAMQRWLEHRNRENPKAVFREMRIGVHTGRVVAGVIGKNKFAYDIWGDAVNLASRLEALGEPGRVNISGATFEIVKQKFACEYRGKKKVHNKGLVDMYFIRQGEFFAPEGSEKKEA